MAKIPRAAQVYQPQAVPEKARVITPQTTSRPKKERDVGRKNTTQKVTTEKTSPSIRRKMRRQKIFSFGFFRNWHPSQIEIDSKLQIINSWGVFLAGLMLIGATLILAANFLRIEEIDCSLDSQPCADEIKIELERFKGEPLLFNDLERKIDQVSILDHQLSSIIIKKNLFGRVKVDLKSAPVLYQLKMDEQILTMNTNQILQNFSGQNLIASTPYPIIEIEFEPLKNETLQMKKVPAFYHQSWLELISGWQNSEYSTKIKQIILTADEKLHLKTAEVDFIFDQTDLNLSWQKFDYIWKNLTEAKIKSYQEIDLRFNSPVAVPKED